MRRFIHLLLAAVLGSSLGILARRATTAPAPMEAVPEVREAQKGLGAPAALPGRVAVGHEEVPPYPTGYVALGRRVTVQFSDGTTRTEVDPELDEVHRNGVILSGRKLFFRPAPRAAATQGPAVSAAASSSPEPSQGDTVSPYPPPPAEPSSSWQMHSDGVLRLTPSAQAAMRARGLSQ